MSFWQFLDQIFEKVIVIFGICTLEFVEMKNIVRNKKIKSILGPKLPYLGIVGFTFEKVLPYLKSASSNW